MLVFHKENTVLQKKKSKKTLPTTMLASLVILNSVDSDIYMVDIDDMKCQLHHIYLVKYWFQQ